MPSGPSVIAMDLPLAGESGDATWLPTNGRAAYKWPCKNKRSGMYEAMPGRGLVCPYEGSNEMKILHWDIRSFLHCNRNSTQQGASTHSRHVTVMALLCVHASYLTSLLAHLRCGSNGFKPGLGPPIVADDFCSHILLSGKSGLAARALASATQPSAWKRHSNVWDRAVPGHCVGCLTILGLGQCNTCRVRSAKPLSRALSQLQMFLPCVCSSPALRHAYWVCQLTGALSRS